MAGSRIIKGKLERENVVVFDYVPKKFPIEITIEADHFISSQEGEGSDFKISELVSQQTGIAALQKAKIKEKVEKETLEKLKEIQEKAYQEAYELGLIEGTEKAFKESSQEFKDRLEKMDELFISYSQFTPTVFAEREAQLMKLIKVIASKIAMFEIESKPECILDLVTQLVEEINTSERLRLRVSEKDASFLESLRDKLDMQFQSSENIKVEPDNTIDPGGCILESNYGVIDASIPRRVERIWEAMQEKLPRINVRHEIPEEAVDNVTELKSKPTHSTPEVPPSEEKLVVNGEPLSDETSESDDGES